MTEAEVESSQESFILEATEDLAYHIRCPLKLLFTCVSDIEQVADIYFGCKVCDSTVALYQGEETFVEHIRTCHPEHYTSDQAPPIPTRAQNDMRNLQMIELDQTDGNRDEDLSQALQSISQQPHDEDVNKASNAGQEIHFVIEEQGNDIKIEPIPGDENNDNFRFVELMKPVAEQYEDDGASQVTGESGTEAEAEAEELDEEYVDSDARPVKRQFDPRVLAVLRRKSSATPKAKIGSKVKTEVMVNDDGVMVLNPIASTSAAASGEGIEYEDPDYNPKETFLKEDDPNYGMDDYKTPKKRGRKPMTLAQKMNRYVCKYCGKSCTFRKALEDHEMAHEGIKPYVCNICGSRFTKQANMMSHQKIHSGLKPFMCEVCPKSFVMKSQLTAHRRVHSNERPHKCDYCEKGFKDRTSLKMHHMTHTGENPYMCDQCGKAFRFNIDLKVHIADHEGRNPLTCKVCGKKFSKRHNFTKHMYVHTGEKRYQCRLCSARFREKSHLNRHFRLHSGIRPFHCDMGCNKSFPDLGALNRHRRTHTTAYKCSVCDKTFTQKHHAERHLSIHLGTVYK